jgi:hypothetical protein
MSHQLSCKDDEYPNEVCDYCGDPIDIDEAVLDDDAVGQFCDPFCQDAYYAKERAG